ncbi:phosphate ABC transporter substrate-binding protein [Scatolibacter rhodanostii]|uniref:phosphate ABC transporter substrate-binding protein n=1 Tax=Scatolibacter rhodanostii TaxID=2014781 RepID=UPI0035228CB3
MRKIAVFAITAVLALTLAACGNQAQASESSASSAKESSATVESKKESAPASEAAKELSGKITLAGSTSMEKLANAVAESFMEENNGVSVTAEFTGSSAGIESLLAGSVDIGNASRELKESEISAGAVENVVAIDGIAIVVHPDNATADLTKENLTAIYKGEITNWSEVGGKDDPIVVVGREAGSGTRGAFEEILDVEDACKYALELDSTGTVVAKVASTSGAIGYVSLDMVDETVKAVKLNGVEATAEKIKAGDYFLSRPFVMATSGEVTEQNELVQALFAYIYSDAGSQLIESVGLIATE